MIKVLAAILLFFSVSVSANNGQELLGSVQKKYSSINDLSADFKKMTNNKTDFSGKFFYKKENKVRLEVSSLTIVSDGKTNWNYNKKNNKVIISEYDEADPSVFSLNKLLFDYPSQCTVSAEGEVLVLTPKKNSDLRFNNIKLWVDKNNLINKVVIDDSNSGKVEIHISGYRLNQNLDNSKFTLTPPEGSTVIDLR